MAASATRTFIGLPGNPVSSFVTFLLLVRPFLLGCRARATWPPAVAMRADFDWPRADRRREFLRARRNAQGGLDLFANQSSGVLTSTVWADGLVDNPGRPGHRAWRHGALPAAGGAAAMKVDGPLLRLGPRGRRAGRETVDTTASHARRRCATS